MSYLLLKWTYRLKDALCETGPIANDNSYHNHKQCNDQTLIGKSRALQFPVSACVALHGKETELYQCDMAASIVQEEGLHQFSYWTLEVKV